MTLYLRRERRTGQEDYEIHAYYDAECVEEAGVPDDVPRVGAKRVRMHGFCWKAIWFEDMN